MEFAEKLLNLGTDLLTQPSNSAEIVGILHETESILSKVDQSPKKFNSILLIPLKKALTKNDIFRHSDVNVKISVTLCIAEVMRITAPVPPYNDDLMKDIFQMTVDSIKDMDDLSSSLYMKRVSILDIHAKIRSCLLLLDFGCNELIIRMFNHFFKVLSVNHPDNVSKAMETIMTNALEESDDISYDLALCLLSSVKKDNKDFSPIASSLGEKVIRNCCAKFKPRMMEVVHSTCSCWRDYRKFVGSMFHDNLKTKSNKSGECMQEDGSLSEGTVSEELPIGTESMMPNISCRKGGINEDNLRNENTLVPLEDANDLEHNHLIGSKKSSNSTASPIPSGTFDAKHHKRGRHLVSKSNVEKENVDRSNSEIKQSISAGKKTAGSSVKCRPQKQKTRKGMEPMESKNCEKDLANDSQMKLTTLSKTDKCEIQKVVSREKIQRHGADLDEKLIGSRINVWWPIDKKFYEGVVGSYNQNTKKHTILYVDGEKENLLLSKERWKYVQIDGSKSDDEDGDLSHLNLSVMPSKKAKIKSEVPKKMKGTARNISSKNLKGDGSDKKLDDYDVKKCKETGDTNEEHPDTLCDLKDGTSTLVETAVIKDSMEKSP